MNEKKRRGGAARLRDTNKKLLLTAGSQCHNLLNMFSTLTEKQKPNNFKSDESPGNPPIQNNFRLNVEEGKLFENEAVNETQNGQINNDIIGRDFGSASTNMSSDFSYFKKPKSLALGEFFDFHPHQPHLTHPFKSSKVFLGKNNIQRRWLTYDEHSEKLFCSVCLAFSSERNIFIDGFNTWSHVYQRVQEHEIIKSHNLFSEAFLNYSSKKTIDYRLFSEHLHKKKIEVTKNRNILQRVIDVIKLIGKRGLSYRGHRNERADSLNDSTLDHGNFLDILLLLKKYDVVLSEHIDSITKNASVNHKKGKGKGRVIIDSTKSPLKAAALFVILNDLANYFKESYKRMNVWMNFVGENNKKRLQSISNTRWWSKEVALKRIFGSDAIKDLKHIQRDMSGVKVMAKRFIVTMSEKLESIETENIDIVACERSFSILKYLKNRLRSTLNESKLEAFMIMSIEKDTLFKINTDEVIASRVTPVVQCTRISLSQCYV
ncbi:hypothetical protein QTP88_027669 [Uroleucon formosanum]